MYIPDFFFSWRKFTTCSLPWMSEAVVAWGNTTAGQAHTHTPAPEAHLCALVF